jgi:hypothetical protein
VGLITHPIRTNWYELKKVAVTNISTTTDWPMFLRVLGVPDTNLPPDLVAWWPLNGDALDASGNGHNGTVFNATTSSGRHGEASRAYFFNGSNAYIQVPDAHDLELSNDFSIAVWFRSSPDSDTSDTSGDVLISKHVSGSNDGKSWAMFLAAIFPSTNSVWFQPPWNISAAHSGQTLKNSWVHSVFTYNDTTKNWSFYKNGNIDASGTQALDIADTAFTLLIGAENASTGVRSFLRGDIDDIKVFDRALTSDEAWFLYSRLE